MKNKNPKIGQPTPMQEYLYEFSKPVPAENAEILTSDIYKRNYDIYKRNYSKVNKAVANKVLNLFSKQRKLFIEQADKVLKQAMENPEDGFKNKMFPKTYKE